LIADVDRTVWLNAHRVSSDALFAHCGHDPPYLCFGEVQGLSHAPSLGAVCAMKLRTYSTPPDQKYFKINQFFSSRHTIQQNAWFVNKIFLEHVAFEWRSADFALLRLCSENAPKREVVIPMADTLACQVAK
jgi:hypothetical protein